MYFCEYFDSSVNLVFDIKRISPPPIRVQASTIYKSNIIQPCTATTRHLTLVIPSDMTTMFQYRGKLDAGKRLRASK